MSYLVLARKSRPQNFDQVVGQRPVVKTLQNSIERERVAHAILFSGVRGVGKTTLARIMAKAINCENLTERNPCNTCKSCMEITQGSSIDLTEIDGASNRGIQEIRELKEKIRFLPTASKYKIIIIDEVHMLTTEAFNALLKTLEEPPEHVYFMFATTELHKIPITILSRCQRYELKRIAPAELSEHFKTLALSEGFEIDPQALEIVVRESEGSVRDGLSLLDQLFSFGEKQLTADDVTQVLGLVDRNVLLTITSALLEGNHTTALTTLSQTFNFGIDLKRFTTDLLACFRTLILCKLQGCNELLDLPEQEITLFSTLAESYSLETVHSKLTLLMQAVEEMRFSSQPQLVLETSFIKIIEAGNVVPVTTLLGKLDSLLAAAPPMEQPAVPPHQNSAPPRPAPAQKKTAPPEQITPHAPPEAPVPQPKSTPPAPAPEHPPSPSATGEPTAAPQQSAPPKQVTPEPEPPVSEPPPEMVEDEQTAPPPIHAHERDVRRHWREFIDYVKERKIWMAQDLQRVNSAKQEDHELLLHYDDPANCTLLRQKEHRKLLTEFVLDFFQKELKVRFILPDAEVNDGDDGEATPQNQRQQLTSDPLVQMAVEIFSGQIGDIRVGPRSR